MAQRGNYTHERTLELYLEEFKKDGWRVVNLKGCTPDGIVVKNNFVAAVEILTLSENDSPYSRDMKKREQYSMFDKVFIRKVYRDEDLDEYVRRNGRKIW